MYGSQFDGAAAFAGGGFMTSQTTQTAEPSSSSTFTKRDTQTLIPLTVKQINKALLSNDDKVNFLIDGVDVNNVKLVGMIVNKAERVTDVSFLLDDGTGRIDCNRWVNDSVDTKEMQSMVDGMYVRVNGQLKSFQGKKQLVVFGINPYKSTRNWLERQKHQGLLVNWPVTDFDEITHHFVECIYVHTYNTKLTKLQPGSSTSNQAYMPSSAVNTPSYQNAPLNQFTGQHVADGLKGIDKMVLDYLQQPGSLSRESGVHLEELAKQLGVSSERISESLNCLVDEGLVYSSIDDYHFKSTGNA